MKIKRIKVENFKPVSEQEINLNGCSAIVTAANDKGKSSALRGLVDRLRSEKADKIVKEGEKKGNYTMELTDGSVIEWNFTKKSERLSYTTPEGIKQTSGVIGAIGEKYFGKGFDIDGFLRSGPKAQQSMMEEFASIDLSDVEARYKEAYDDRTEKNRELKRISSQSREEPKKVGKPDVSSIKEELKKGREKNEYRQKQINRHNELDQIYGRVMNEIEDTPFSDLFDSKKAHKIIEGIEYPDRVDVSELEQELDQAQEQLRKYDSYERDLNEYKKWVEAGKEARKEAEKANEKVKAIEQEKKELIANADLPEGFDITENGLTYNGFLLDENQISKSSKYIAALKLGAMVAGEVKALHFDASTLDNKNLKDVQEWAESKDLQLLIERPDLEGGEIKYELIKE